MREGGVDALLISGSIWKEQAATDQRNECGDWVIWRHDDGHSALDHLRAFVRVYLRPLFIAFHREVRNGQGLLARGGVGYSGGYRVFSRRQRCDFFDLVAGDAVADHEFFAG